MATITGTENADQLPGTDDGDLINAFGGADTITGGGGNDTMNGGSGDDTFVIAGASFGNDQFNGGDGADRVSLRGDVSVARFSMTSANMTSVETLDFSIYSLSGTGGNDVFNISGFASIASYRWINLFDGDDSFVGYSGADFVNGGVGNDTLSGGAGADQLIGGGGNDRLIGGTGDDTFLVGGIDIGTDIFDGGSGDDEVRLTGDITVRSLKFGSANIIGTERLDFSIYTISGTGANDVFDISGFSAVSSYRTIDLADGNDRFTGWSGYDDVRGGDGNDTLDGGAGNDLLSGGAGKDSLVGGSGNDTFYIGGSEFGADIYNGGSGADEIRLVADVTVSRLFLTSNVIATETLDLSIYSVSGTGGSDTISISGINNVQSYREIDLFDGHDTFIGYSGYDIVDGGSGNDTLNGGAGNDSLNGGAGNDSLVGGTGDDVFYIGGASIGTDRFDGGSGSDTIRLTSDLAGSFAFTSSNLRSVEILNFGIYDLDGSGRSDRIDLSGVRSISSYRTIDLDDGSDTFIGMSGADYANGGSGNDTLSGGSGNDMLAGDAGSDLIYGGTGRDELTGGSGADRFRFTVNDSADTITDWVNGSDSFVIKAGRYDGDLYDSFGDLDIYGSGDSTIIRFGGTRILLEGVSVREINSADFDFV